MTSRKKPGVAFRATVVVVVVLLCTGAAWVGVTSLQPSL